MESRAPAVEDRAMPSSLALAYLGDTIYDLYVREVLVRRGGKVKDMHRAAIAHVRASAQSEALARVESELTEAERAVVRRARNCKQTPTGHADPAQYHAATGLEALLGYLYLKDERERIAAIMRLAEPNV